MLHEGELGSSWKGGVCSDFPMPKASERQASHEPEALDINQGGTLAEADSLWALDGFSYVTFEREFVRNVREM